MYVIIGSDSSTSTREVMAALGVNVTGVLQLSVDKVAFDGTQVLLLGEKLKLTDELVVFDRNLAFRLADAGVSYWVPVTYYGFEGIYGVTRVSGYGNLSKFAPRRLYAFQQVGGDGPGGRD